MQRCTARARYEFIHLLMKHAEITPATVTADNPNIVTEGDIQRVAQRLLRYGATYGRLQEQDCNVGLTDKERVKESRLALRMADLSATIGCKVYLSGDPRGNTVKVIVPDGFTNDWGREGICVPTS